MFSSTVANKSVQQMDFNVRDAFRKWKDQTMTLATLNDVALEVGRNQQQDFVSSYLI